MMHDIMLLLDLPLDCSNLWKWLVVNPFRMYSRLTLMLELCEPVAPLWTECGAARAPWYKCLIIISCCYGSISLKVEFFSQLLNFHISDNLSEIPFFLYIWHILLYEFKFIQYIFALSVKYHNTLQRDSLKHISKLPRKLLHPPF